jgi:hypothetical protein
MRQSDDVTKAMLHFYSRLSASDVASFDDVVARDAQLIIGTAPGVWVTQRGRMRFGFETEGVTLQAGPAPVGF